MQPTHLTEREQMTLRRAIDFLHGTYLPDTGRELEAIIVAHTEMPKCNLPAPHHAIGVSCQRDLGHPGHHGWATEDGVTSVIWRTVDG